MRHERLLPLRLSLRALRLRAQRLSARVERAAEARRESLRGCHSRSRSCPASPRFRFLHESSSDGGGTRVRDDSRDTRRTTTEDSSRRRTVDSGVPRQGGRGGDVLDSRQAHAPSDPTPPGRGVLVAADSERVRDEVPQLASPARAAVGDVEDGEEDRGRRETLRLWHRLHHRRVQGVRSRGGAPEAQDEVQQVRERRLREASGEDPRATRSGGRCKTERGCVWRKTATCTRYILTP